MVTINAAGWAALKVRLNALALEGAEAAVPVLREKLSGEGSGRQHAGFPRRSSAPGEYPAEQSGELMRSIHARPSNRPGFAEFGSINGPEYVTELMTRPPDAGGRPFMDDAQHDRDIRQAIVKAVRRRL